MARLLFLVLLLLAPIECVHSISLTDLPLQLQTCIGTGECIVDTSGPVVTIGQMEAYLFANNLKASPVTGYALRYSLLPPSGQTSDSGSFAYGGDIWLTVQGSYELALDSNPITVYTDKVTPQPTNILFGDSNGLDIDIVMSNAALLSGSGFELVGLDANNMDTYQANMNLISDFGGNALVPCLAEGCLATAGLNLIYLTYLQSGTTATLQFNPSDNRGLLYQLTSDYNADPASGGSFLSQTYYVAAVPLPSTVWLFASGLLGLAGVSRQRKLHKMQTENCHSDPYSHVH